MDGPNGRQTSSWARRRKETFLLVVFNEISLNTLISIHAHFKNAYAMLRLERHVCYLNSKKSLLYFTRLFWIHSLFSQSLDSFFLCTQKPFANIRTFYSDWDFLFSSETELKIIKNLESETWKFLLCFCFTFVEIENRLTFDRIEFVQFEFDNEAQTHLPTHRTARDHILKWSRALTVHDALIQCMYVPGINVSLNECS